MKSAYRRSKWYEYYANVLEQSKRDWGKEAKVKRTYWKDQGKHWKYKGQKARAEDQESVETYGF